MKVYILEDEKNILRYIVSLIKKDERLECIGSSATIEKAQDEIPILKPDLLLADIQLKDGDSFTLLNSINFNGQIIFITAYNKYAIDAINIGAFAYLLKPIDTEEYKKAIERSYLKNVQQQQIRLQLGKDYYDGNQEVHKIALSNENFTEIVDVNSIIYCRSEKGYTIFHLRDGNQVVVSKTLKKI